MDMTGKAVPVYRRIGPPTPLDRLIVSGDVNGNPCTITTSIVDGEQFLVATVTGKSVAISFHELLGIAAAEGE